ncbi:MAG: DNA translocase FtsK [Thermoflexales bacterium]|nr:DNA translocase FtsK [Thermoflexales bacterium]
MQSQNRNLPVPLPSEVRTTGVKILRSLDQQGFVHQNGDGSTFSIGFSAIHLYGDSLAGFEVDAERMWHLSVADLAKAGVVTQISAAIRKPVRAIHQPHRGFLFLVQLKPPPQVRLPRSVPLDLGQRPPGSLMVPLGIGRTGPAWRSLPQLGHILVGGATGSGKSNWLQCLLVALLTCATPDQLRLVMVDPKLVEFAPWANAPHLLRPVAHSLKEATLAVQDLFKEVDRRLELFTAAQVRDLAGYNRTARTPLPVILLLVDEFLDLAVEGGANSPFYTTLTRHANRARAAGVKMVLSATTPKAEVMNTSLRNACTTRLAFRCNEAGQSRVILETSGAEKLPPTSPGRFLARLPDLPGLRELQAWHVDDKALAAAAASVRGQATEAAPSQPVFTKDELAVAEVLLKPVQDEGLDGMFSVRSLAIKLQGRVSYRHVANIGQQWEARGWLGEQLSPTSGRPVTGEFRRVAASAGVG